MKFSFIINKQGKIPKQAIADMQRWFVDNAGKKVTATLEKFKKERSKDQNAYYWAVIVKMISDETGYEKNEVHELLAAHFIGTKKIKIGGLEKEVYKSTAKLTTTDFMGYIEEIQRWSAEKLNLYIPDPNELEKEY